MVAYKSLKTKQKSTALTTIWPYKTNPKLLSQDSCLLAFFVCVFIDLNFFSVLKMQNRKKLMNLANIQPSWLCAYIQLNGSGKNTMYLS